jgi:hypothetical protein
MRAPRCGKADHCKPVFDPKIINVRGDSRFESSVVVDILDNLNGGFGVQPVADGVSPRPMFTPLRY